MIGTEPATTAIGTLGGSEDPWLAFWRLRRYGPEALAALRPIRAWPKRGLIPCRQAMPARRVRAIDQQTARSALRNPTALSFLAGGTEPKATDVVLDCPLAEQTLDTAANRCLLTILRAVEHRARALVPVLQKQVDQEEASETRTMLASRWAARRQFLVRLSAELRSEMRKPPFSDVTRTEISAAGLNAISADPAYARAYRLAWHAIRRGVSGPPTTERLWMSPSWEIYERWCFVAFGRLLQESFAAFKWERVLTSSGWSLGGVSSDGERSLELSLQPIFRSEKPSGANGRWSVSLQRVPDLVLTEQSPAGTRFWVFDAKYRTSRRNVLEAMASAHIYRDSLRVRERRAEASWIVVPSGGGAPWLENPGFQERHGVGIHVLAPGQDPTLPRTLLEHLAN